MESRRPNLYDWGYLYLYLYLYLSPDWVPLRRIFAGAFSGAVKKMRLFNCLRVKGRLDYR